MDSFQKELIEMRQMYFTIEREFLEFNEIIPYQYNEDWNKITSPKLANLMLSICPQIEKMLKTLVKKMNLKPEQESSKFPHFIKVLDTQKMLSIQTVGIANPGYANTLFNPFEKKNGNYLDWWQGYNKIKHDLPGGITHGTLQNTIYSLAALSILHHIAYILITWGNEDYTTILDSKEWYFDEDVGVRSQTKNEELRPNELPVWWNSKLFFFPTKRYQFV